MENTSFKKNKTFFTVRNTKKAPRKFNKRFSKKLKKKIFSRLLSKTQQYSVLTDLLHSTLEDAKFTTPHKKVLRRRYFKKLPIKSLLIKPYTPKEPYHFLQQITRFDKCFRVVHVSFGSLMQRLRFNDFSIVFRVAKQAGSRKFFYCSKKMFLKSRKFPPVSGGFLYLNPFSKKKEFVFKKIRSFRTVFKKKLSLYERYERPRRRMGFM